MSFSLLDGSYHLYKAVRENQIDLVEKLLKNGAKPNMKDNDGSTPLHIAIENGNVDVARILLKFSADVCAKDKYGRTVLDTAFWNGDEELIISLLEKINDINISTNNRDDTPLHLAVELCTPKLVGWILKKGANVNSKKYRGRTPLHVVSMRGNAQIAKQLLESHADFNCKDEEGDTALIIASRHGNEEVVSALLNYNVDVNIRVRRGESALHLLIENKVKSKIIRLLLEKSANVNTGSIINRTPLHICAIYGQTESAATLLEFEANANLQDTNGQTPLHLACMQGNEGVINILLQHNANINIVNELGKTPLHYAALFGCGRIVQLLLEQGADPNARNIDGRTPLAYSIYESVNIESVYLLIQYGANINCLDIYGQTPLHMASRSGDKNMVLLLLNLGADINALDWEYRTPLNTAYCDPLKNRGIIVTLENHLVMRKVVGLFVCAENLELINYDDELNDFQNICLEEMNKMKRKKIGKSNVSYHDILIKSIHDIVKMTRNKEVENGFRNIDFATFPLYSNMIEPLIRRNFEHALIRRDLLEEAFKSFYKTFRKLPKLPTHCIDKIFTYLSNTDVKNWIMANYLRKCEKLSL